MKLSTHNKSQRSEVDIRVAQEIKNNQDFIYDTNQTLQKLSGGVAELALCLEKNISKAESDRKALLIEFENLQKTVLLAVHQMNQRLGDIEVKMQKSMNQISDFREELTEDYMSVEHFDAVQKPQQVRVNILEKEMHLKMDYFNRAVDQLRSHVRDQIDVAKKEMAPVIPEVDPMKTYVDHRFSAISVDFQGFFKEIALIKAALNYDQKKFENLYTLIERLKGAR